MSESLFGKVPGYGLQLYQKETSIKASVFLRNTRHLFYRTFPVEIKVHKQKVLL